MGSLLALKMEQDGFEVQFEVLSPVDSTAITNPYQREIKETLESVEAQLDICEQQAAKLNNEIDLLTNRADGLDYAISVTSGLVTGIIDSIFVGEWDFEKAKAISNQEANNMVIAFAKKDPRYLPWCSNTAHGRKTRDPNRLVSAVEFLENAYTLPGDNDWNVKGKLVNLARKKGFSGKGYEAALEFMNANFPKPGGWDVTENFITPRSHHLDDFCHHPTIVGLICCIIVQFTNSTMYVNKYSDSVKIQHITVNKYGKLIGETSATKVFSGVVNWFFNVARTIANRKGHLLSDAVGSISSAASGGSGMGLPGSFLSTMKELSALSIFKDTNFGENLRKAFENGIGPRNNQIDLGAFNQLFEGASSKLDQRTENAVAHELKRQSLPIIINEALVRGTYFIRRFIEQIKIKKSLAEMDWKAVLPFRNRTIIRMLTIATSTFTVFDMADAAIRSGGINAACLLRVNFVGVGRFAVAVVTDTGMGINRNRLQNERFSLISQQLDLLNVKVQYSNSLAEHILNEALAEQSIVWVSAGDTVSTLMAANDRVGQAISFYKDSLRDISDTLDHTGNHIKKLNPARRLEMLDTLLYGG